MQAQNKHYVKKRRLFLFNTKDCIEMQNILLDLQYLKDNMDMRNGKV